MRRRGGRRGSETKFRQSSYWQTIARNERRMVPIAGGGQTLLGREIGGDGWRMKCHCASSCRLLRSTNDQHIRKCLTRKCWHSKRDGDIAELTNLQADGFSITFRVQHRIWRARSALGYSQMQSNPNAVVRASLFAFSLRKAKDKVDFEAGEAVRGRRGGDCSQPSALTILRHTRRAAHWAKNAESKSCSVSKRHETSAEFFFLPFPLARSLARRTPRSARLGSAPAAAAAEI